MKNSSNKNLMIIHPNPHKKKTLELIKEYLNSQPEEIKKIESMSDVVYNSINKFIEFTQSYCDNITQEALKIAPNYTPEGRLAQAVQSIFLFCTEELNNLITKLKEINGKVKEKGQQSLLDKFKERQNIYFQKIKNLEAIMNKYRKEINSYQNYLINEEFNEHVKNGNRKNNDDEIIEDNKNNINNEDNKEDKNENPNVFETLNNIDLGLEDNRNNLIETQKAFLSSINECNDVFKKIKEFLSEEKTNIRKNIFNVCDCLIEELIKCGQNQKKNYDIMNDVIKKEANQLKFEETDYRIVCCVMMINAIYVKKVIH